MGRGRWWPQRAPPTRHICARPDASFARGCHLPFGYVKNRLGKPLLLEIADRGFQESEPSPTLSFARGI